MRRLVVLTAVFAAVSGFILVQGLRLPDTPPAHPDGAPFVHAGAAGGWFQRAKSHCNSVLLDALAALARARAAGADAEAGSAGADAGPSGDPRDVADLARELERDAEIQAEARREVEALLA